MAIPSAFAALSADKRSLLEKVAKPKLNAYFAFTSLKGGGMQRSVPDPNGQPWFIYPNETLVSDLTFLWTAFVDVYEAVGGPDAFADLIKADLDLLSDFRRILEGHSQQDQDASFWSFPGGRVSTADAISTKLGDVLKTLRNGFAHSHWSYTNVSATDYWTTLGWDTAGAPPAFDLAGRPAKNAMLYIADAKPPWQPSRFWQLRDLRILVTPSVVLRYHLHLCLNSILNGSRDNVFQQ